MLKKVKNRLWDMQDSWLSKKTGELQSFANINDVDMKKFLHSIFTGVNQKLLPVLSTETVLHLWLSTEYYGFRPSSTAVDTVSLHALDPTVPRKRMQIGFLLAPIVKEVSNIVIPPAFMPRGI